MTNRRYATTAFGEQAIKVLRDLRRVELAERRRQTVAWRLPGFDPVADHAACGEEWFWQDPQDHVRSAVHSCESYGCPVDMSDNPHVTRWRNGWSTREAGTIADELGPTAVHVIVSPPGPGPDGGRTPCPPPVTVSAYENLRRTAYARLRWLGLGNERTAWVWHPFRCVTANRQGGHDGAHWHVLTHAWIDFRMREAGNPESSPTAVLWAETGWTVKVLGDRPTRTTAIYELHHTCRAYVVPIAHPNPASWARRHNRAPEPEVELLTCAVTWTGTRRERPEKPASEGIWCGKCQLYWPACDWVRVRPVPGPDGTTGWVEIEGAIRRWHDSA